MTSCSVRLDITDANTEAGNSTLPLVSPVVEKSVTSIVILFRRGLGCRLCGSGLRGFFLGFFLLMDVVMDDLDLHPLDGLSNLQQRLIRTRQRALNKD